MINIFLQARLDSSRLPEKALLPLAKNRNCIQLAFEALRQCRNIDRFALLTTEEAAERFRPYCDEFGFALFAGDKFDVLKRFADGSKEHPSDFIIRATGDNPLVSHEIIDRLCERYGGLGDDAPDYSGFIGNPIGTGVEMVKTSALRIAHAEAVSDYDREHVTPFLYKEKNRGRFAVALINAPPQWCYPGSVTLDTADDYKHLIGICQALYRGAPIPLAELTAYLRREA